MCCNSWGRKESDTTKRLNLTELKAPLPFFPQESYYSFLDLPLSFIDTDIEEANNCTALLVKTHLQHQASETLSGRKAVL